MVCIWKTLRQYHGTHLDSQNNNRKILTINLSVNNNQNKVSNQDFVFRTENRAVDAKDAVNQREDQYSGNRHLFNLPSVEIEDHIIE